MDSDSRSTVNFRKCRPTEHFVWLKSLLSLVCSALLFLNFGMTLFFWLIKLKSLLNLASFGLFRYNLPCDYNSLGLFSLSAFLCLIMFFHFVCSGNPVCKRQWISGFILRLAVPWWLMKSFIVSLEMMRTGELSPTDFTLVWTITVVYTTVSLELLRWEECFLTAGAGESLLPQMHPLVMFYQVGLSGVGDATKTTQESFLPSVDCLVYLQLIFPDKCLVTDITLVRPQARV